MKLRLNDLTLIIQFENKNEEKLIKKFVTFKDDKNAFFGGRFHPERVKDVCLGKDIKEYFVCFAGFTKEIMLFAKQNNIQVSEFEDKRTHFKFQDKEWTHDELRKFFNPKFKYVEHQIRALQAMIKTNTGICKLPTSAGKSKILSGYCKLTKLPTLVLNDRATLVLQLYDDLIEEGFNAGYCTGKGYKDGDVVVSTIQSVKKIPNLEKFKCVIVDEVQRGCGNTFQEFMSQFSCPLKFGLSASPNPGDYLKYAKIRQFFGSVIIDVQAEELMSNEVMCRPDLRLIKVECPEGFDYHTSYSEGIIHNKERNKKIINIANSHTENIAILVTNMEHGKILENEIPGSIFINGQTSIEDRQKIIKNFGKTFRVLIGSDILREGVSIPAIDTLIIANGQKSEVSSTQRVGRALRQREGKKCIIYDFIDAGNKFLLKHSKIRIKVYKNCGYEPKIIEE